MAWDFRGKVALITGSSRGIGRATALRLAREGAHVVVHYRQNREMAEEVAQQIHAAGSKAITVQADLAQADDVRRLFQETRKAFGYLDFYVANAAATAFRPFLEQKEYHLERTFNITIRAFFIGVHEAASLMQGRRGKIVTVSGYDSFRYIPGHSILGAAKAGLESLTRSLAAELAPLGISVNGVCPGLMETDSARIFAGDRWEEFTQSAIKSTPKARLGQPDDIANVIAFLCSDESEWICGQTIIADGGFLSAIHV